MEVGAARVQKVVSSDATAFFVTKDVSGCGLFVRASLGELLSMRVMQRTGALNVGG